MSVQHEKINYNVTIYLMNELYSSAYLMLSISTNVANSLYNIQYSTTLSVYNPKFLALQESVDNACHINQETWKYLTKPWPRD